MKQKPSVRKFYAANSELWVKTAFLARSENFPFQLFIRTCSKQAYKLGKDLQDYVLLENLSYSTHVQNHGLLI